MKKIRMSRDVPESSSKAVEHMDVNAIIKGVVPFDVNDEPYFTIYFAHEAEPENVLEARLPAGSIYPHPHVNDHICVHYVLKVPTHIERAED